MSKTPRDANEIIAEFEQYIGDGKSTSGMTTKPQPTPYDAEIEALRRNTGISQAYQDLLVEQLEEQRLGYLRAKAEDAALLAACEGLLAHAKGKQCDETCLCQSNARAAIARAKEG